MYVYSLCYDFGNIKLMQLIKVMFTLYTHHTTANGYTNRKMENAIL